ncbi:MAG: RagB/SusD family nutrient uptake outer membrane protein [Barnesiella sp.]|nr:RagB/SusD family nutrient uptake outer membrane protein [Barnesiella sp.]
MKTIYKSLIAVLAVTPAFTGCIDETTPTNIVTETQLGSSAKATEALLWAMPAYYNKFDIMNNNQAYDWGYGAIMHVRDVMTEDMPIEASGYDWFTGWEFNQYIGQDYMRTQWVWNFYNKQVLTTNNVLSAINVDDASEQMLAYYGMALGFRASTYLDMARMYEFLPNDAVSSVNNEGNDVLGLTVPIVTEKTTEAESRDNPRVSHEDMFKFIMADLDLAEQYLTGKTRQAKTLMDITVIWGLKARAYMWNEDYAKAAEYARKAIDSNQYRPLSREEWLSTTSGFNDLSLSSWMWGAQAVKEDECVQSGILNWTAWMSNEAIYGYAAAGPFVKINKSTYDKMNDRDFRKLSFKAPEGSALEGQEPVLDASWAAELPAYSSFKFRPGAGNTSDFNVGSATALPLMRIEEMYLIEAEATAQTSPAAGKKLIEDFMKTYRYATYTCNASDKDGVVNEIFFQKRVELFGEGQSFFDYKRLNKGVTRGYTGTNFQQSAQFNTTTRPAWMNFCIVATEGLNNLAIEKWNNPDPSDKYTSLKY